VAIFGSLIVNRQIKGFLACDDLESDKGKEYIAKLIESGKDAVEKILHAIPDASEKHQKSLRHICDEILKTTSIDVFLDEMDNDETKIRDVAKDILNASQSITPGFLLNKLNDPNASVTQLIDVVEFQKAHLKPEQIITQALKLSGKESARLFKMANDLAEKFDIDAFELQPAKVDSADKKLHMMNFLSLIKKPKSAEMVAQFLEDKNHMVKIAALNSLRSINQKFDVYPLLKNLPNMKETEQKLATPLIVSLVDEKLIPRLASMLAHKDETIRALIAQLIIEKSTTDCFRRLLIGIEKSDEWTRGESISLLVNKATGKLSKIAKPLLTDGNEFIRESAAKFVDEALETGTIEGVSHPAFNDDWQIRDKAILALGESKQKSALKILAQVIKIQPDAAISVLKAVGVLRFTKGLEIAVKGMNFKEVAVQRESLKTIRLLANEKHAQGIQDVLLKKIVSLDLVVRDTAEEVLTEINQAFRLKALPSNLDALLKSDPTQEIEQAKLDVPEQAAQQISMAEKEESQHDIFNLDELQQGFKWADRYLIQKEIGRGAMGRVLLADDEMIDETIIIKFMHPELTADKDARERFIRELKYARKISHTNVIRIHDFLYQRKVAAISMEFFESIGLDEEVKKGKIYEEKEGLRVLAQIAAGMQAAHDEDVVHRDLKPSNILINAKGKVKVVDFGIASATAELDANLTKTGTIIGTPAYLSPERAKGMEADHRADIYALGIISYFMFTGELPYKGEPMSLLFQHIEGKAEMVHAKNDQISAKISFLVKKMMAVNLDDRYQTMDDVKLAIDKILG